MSVAPGIPLEPPRLQLCLAVRRVMFAGCVVQGSVLVSIEILPKKAAEARPVGKARKEPNMFPFLPPPTGRIKWVRYQRPLPAPTPCPQAHSSAHPSSRASMFMLCNGLCLTSSLCVPSCCASRRCWSCLCYSMGCV